ncbi:DNA cytosine methyltransferase [Methylomicrobium agile]|uniref:DNA cytosine methyltransferase n=1 Tax=Methylomicrobium agile TaxID=39774 RepID=UPI00068A491B|nr:DNA cytosine methyltransferase [Methylomicrobium agile]
MAAYYNEFAPHAAAWLKQLIAENLIPDGEVDERSIADVQANDLRGFTQCHFFAGIGGWPLALRLAGIEDDFHVWTGSCPCPPFSVAGKKKSCPDCGEISLLPHPYRTGVFVCNSCWHEWHADERHLWPEFHRLIKECRPAIVFGEQVAGKDGEIWLAGVRATLEILGYGVGAANLGAHSAGAYHQRQRLFWVADGDRLRSSPRSEGCQADGYGKAVESDCGVGVVGNAASDDQHGNRQSRSRDGQKISDMGNADGAGLQTRQHETVSTTWGGEKGEQLCNQVVHFMPTMPMRYTSTGELLTGSPAEMKNGAQLNPAHSRWLMGYPKAWCAAAIKAHRSMPTKQPKRG